MSETEDKRPTPAFMRQIYLEGIIGTKEFRGWLAKIDPVFADVRDADVDNEIDQLARERSQARHEEERRAVEEAQIEAERLRDDRG